MTLPDAPRDDGAPATARLSVVRQSERDARQRQVYVSLDGHAIGMLVFGGALTRDIQAGRHSLRFNNTLVWKTVTFDAPAGASVRYRIVNYAPTGFMAMLAVFGVAVLFLEVERDDP